MPFAVRSWIRPRVAAVSLLVLLIAVLERSHSRAWGEEPAATAASATPAVVSDQPTHKQTAIIPANAAGQPQTTLTCFCLTPDDRILAGCGGNTGEIRVFDAAGTFVENWSVPVKPEAIFARADGTIFLAGEGQVAQLTPQGSVTLVKKAPHAEAINQDPHQLREQIVAQAKQQAEALAQQAKQFDQMIEQTGKQIATMKEQLVTLEESANTAKQSDGDDAEAETASQSRAKAAAARTKQMLERRIAMYEQRKQQYEQVKAQWQQIAAQNPPAELTEEQIDAQVKAAMAFKTKASSISAMDDEVFLATPAAAGYGFEIWRTDAQFENATRIVSELRGCCGQMDVKACANGLYVAENARHRVCRYDREGNLVGAWGESARTGLEGFGSCCNPMNVAFGPENAVYTAEDNTGRIKRYSPEGALLSLVGSVDLVPGCKNCSIAVSHDGGRVYMLDITRNHIVRMDAQPEGESAADAGTDKVSQQTSPSKSTTASVVVRSLKALFGSGD